MNRALLANNILSHYRIVSKIGAGGMGEVYLAQDTKLDRKVALKVLPADVASNRDRMTRFVQEAKTASALNHPNIITIHEIDQFESLTFIATEFIDGHTLRERMNQGPIKLGEVIDVTIQIASALAAAHAAGIVHRDIKPDNVMIRRDGITKVLDFGLAKLSAESTTSPDPEAATRALVKTGPGMVMGTAAYMSPEQASGQEVDARTDIFSLGVVIYEMAAGCVPFPGGTVREVLAAILSKEEPPTLTRLAPEVPQELEHIVSKALHKDREHRYQTTGELLLDLQALKQKLDFEAKLDHPTYAVRTPANTKASDGSLPTRTNYRRWSLIIAVVIVVAAGLTYLLYFAKPAGAIDSIAVLPLVNASNDPNTEYLSDGITESIISNLSQLPQLKVMARSTVFHFKGKDTDPREVGRQLGVRAVMVGRLLQQGDQLIVRTELVNVADGTQLWGAEYDRKVSDVLALQQDISREISEKLRLHLSGEDRKRLTERDPTNAESYQFYLRGRYYWNKRTAAGLQKAIEEFQQAIDRDPNYALGYVGLADSYLLLEQVAGIPAADTLPKARAAVDRALQIDASLAEVSTSSAQIYQYSWRWPEAENEFNRAISLNPNYPTAHQWFSVYLRTRRRFDEALREIKRAQELDPLSPIISTNAAFVYYLKNDIDAAIQQDKKVIELNPDFQIAHSDLGWFYIKQQRYDEATSEFQKAVELSGRSSLFLGNLAYCYGVTGRRAEAMALVKELESRYEKHEAIGFFVATPYVALDDKDQVFAWLEKDFGQHSAQLPGILWWPNFERVRNDARYLDLVRRMGLKI